MDQRDFSSPGDSRRGAYIAIAIVAIVAIISLILAALAFGRVAPSVGHWVPLPLSFSGRCNITVNASGTLNGNSAKARTL